MDPPGVGVTRGEAVCSIFRSVRYFEQLVEISNLGYSKHNVMRRSTPGWNATETRHHLPAAYSEELKETPCLD
jgi:hypothetical protein